MSKRVAPVRFLLFLFVFLLATFAVEERFGWVVAVLLGFDAGALLFLITAAPLLRHHGPADLRRHAAENDANRPMLLGITAATMFAILMAVGSALGGDVTGEVKALVVVTLALAWLFSNSVYAMHYAHLYHRSRSSGGLEFQGDSEPDYNDFVYFAFTLGMTFQTSDVTITSRAMRRAVVLHCLAAFVFNLGVIAFTINVLGAKG